MATVMELIELAENNYYGIKNGGEISSLMRQNFDLVLEKLREVGVDVIIPEKFSDVDTNTMEVLEVEPSPELYWYKLDSYLVKDVVSPGFYDRNGSMLIKPARVLAYSTYTLNFSRYILGKTPENWIFNRRFFKTAQDILEAFEVSSMEEVKRVIVEDFAEDEDFLKSVKILTEVIPEDKFIDALDYSARVFNASLYDRRMEDPQGLLEFVDEEFDAKKKGFVLMGLDNYLVGARLAEEVA